jgi:hypothetical protein
MPLEIAAPMNAPASLPLQYITAQIMPLIGGQLSVVLQATLLDEERLEFVGQDLANAHVESIDEALAVIRANLTALNPPSSRAAV